MKTIVFPKEQRKDEIDLKDVVNLFKYQDMSIVIVTSDKSVYMVVEPDDNEYLLLDIPGSVPFDYEDINYSKKEAMTIDKYLIAIREYDSKAEFFMCCNIKDIADLLLSVNY